MSAPFELSQTDHLLSTTRAVRRRLDLERPVEREVILDCVRLSQQAPTASNTQKWRWMVVRDEAKRAAIAEIYGLPGPDIQLMTSLLDNADEPVLAFCRTGTRCTNLWVTSRSEGEKEPAREKAKALGFDLAMSSRC